MFQSAAHLLFRATRTTKLFVAVAALFALQGVSVAAPIDVFLFAGQSNMVGGQPVSALPAELRGKQNDVLFQYRLRHSRFDTVSESSDWIPLEPTVNLGLVGANYGPEITFADELKAKGAATPFAIVKVAANGTSLANNWNPAATKNLIEADAPPLYQVMINKAKSSMDQLRADGYDPRLAGFVWVQGFADSGSYFDSLNYGDNLANLIANVRTDLDAPNLPAIFSRIHADSLRQDYLPELRAGQERVASEDPFAAIVDIDDLLLGGDSVHYSGSAQVALGRRVADAYLATIPEPASFAILGLGTLLLFPRRRTAA